MASQYSRPTSRKLTFTRDYWILIIGIIFIASTLRSPLTSVGPLISLIKSGLHISNVLAGFLTTIPLLAFALISPFAPQIARRFGMERTLFASLVLLTLGIVIRSLGTTPYLLIGTFLLGAAIAFGNVLLPGLIKLNFPLHIGLLTGLYSVAMNLSGSIAAGISIPLAEGTSFGWEGALGGWAILSFVAAIIWLPQLKAKKSMAGAAIATKRQNTSPLWRSNLAWNITLFMGLQSFIFYTCSAWLPEVLKTQGLSAGQAGWMLSLMQFAQLPMTFIIPVIAGKMKNQRMLVLFIASFFLIGFVGIFIGAPLIPLWMIILGLAGGSAFGLAMMFFTLRTHTPHEAADLSGMAQSFGYILAAVGPVFFGLLHDVTSSWSTPLILLFIATAGLFISGMRAGKNEVVFQKES
ncbi:MFS transporter [Bacillus sp. FJAT-50079]|uniref:CynX/NimT family MFS transporter n=1 Tax=Bacillus sp. FJAT-50079 TaxID=2833577 RepID=UPI002015F9CD|nr:MFS transporter [Bacillus sp. FJAT-50079]